MLFGGAKTYLTPVDQSGQASYKLIHVEGYLVSVCVYIFR